MTVPYRTIENLTFKNNVLKEGSWLHIELATYPYPSYVVCNWSDAELLAPHRWRLSGDRVITVIDDADGFPRTWGIENIILRRPRKDRVPHKNEDALDCRRVNLESPRKKTTLEPTRITVKGDTASIHCPSGHTVTIDRDDVELVKSYRWMVFNKNPSGAPYYEIRAKAPTEENPNYTILLHRLVMQFPKGERFLIDYQNGDRLDLRKANLQLKSKPNDTD